MHALLPPLKGKETHKGRGMHRGLSGCRKTPYGLFRQVFAVCRAHSLFAYGEQLAQRRAKSRLRRLRSAQRCGARLAA